MWISHTVLTVGSHHGHVLLMPPQVTYEHVQARDRSWMMIDYTCRSVCDYASSQWCGAVVSVPTADELPQAVLEARRDLLLRSITASLFHSTSESDCCGGHICHISKSELNVSCFGTKAWSEYSLKLCKSPQTPSCKTIPDSDLVSRTASAGFILPMLYHFLMERPQGQTDSDNNNSVLC